MVPISPISEDWLRRRVRVYQMVTELHKIGYQGLRIWPQIHHGRIIFVPSIFVTHSRAHGIVSPMFTSIDNSVGSVSMMATYSTMNLVATYYGNEMARNNAREAANTFIREFPRIAELSLLDDYEYAGWFQRLTGEMEQGLHVGLPQEFEYLQYNESVNPDAHLILWKEGRDSSDDESIVKTFPMPPSPKIGGDDLSRLIKLLLSYLTR